MNGAQALIRTLAGCGVEVCFANPGTSEMHFVAALDAVPEMRGVLCLSEGVVTGAADGYGRMTGRPRPCCTWGPAWATGWRTCTTRAARPRRCSPWSVTMPRITSAWTPRLNRTSIPSPGRCRSGSAARSAPLT